MNIVVTGCAGFIGSRVARLLLQRGHSVQGVDVLNDSNNLRLTQWRLDRLMENPGFTFRHLDITGPSALRPIFSAGPSAKPVQAVVNLAARAGVRDSVADPKAYYETNVLGTLALLELCREFGVPRFILASTSSVYGTGVNGPVVEDAPTNRPLSPYAASKIAAETLLYSYHHLHGMNAAALRYFTVYGPAGRPDMSVFRFVRAIAEDEPITVYGDGTQQRDFTYVDDIAAGTVAALEITGYETINLGSDRPIILNNLIAVIESAVGRCARVEYERRHPADPSLTWAKIGRAREHLGWSPEVGIEEGIRRCVNWYLQNRDWARYIT